MVQEFHVLSCFSCHSYQVHQVKKVTKWSCKMCGEKQSLLKEFGRGSGAECRLHVQKLNAVRGSKMEEQDARSLREAENTQEEPSEPYGPDTHGHTQVSQQAGVSRWSKYLKTPEEEEEEKEEESEEEEEEELYEHMMHRKRKRVDRP